MKSRLIYKRLMALMAQRGYEFLPFPRNSLANLLWWSLQYFALYFSNCRLFQRDMFLRLLPIIETGVAIMTDLAYVLIWCMVP